jgi:hypothetical protein
MIDINKLLRLGKAIKLIDHKDDFWEFGISKLLKEREIICDLIVDSDDMPPIEKNADLKLAISHGSGVYLAPVKIERIPEDSRRLKFFVSKEYEFVQRREYYRLMDPRLEINCKIHDEFCEAKALDLAGGGIGLFIERERPIKKDTLLELKISLPDETTMQVGARATHIVPADEPNKYFVGAYFSKITSSDEAKIMKHIFSEQVRKSKEDSSQSLTE